MHFTLIHGTESARPVCRQKRFGSQVPVYPPLGVLYLASALEQAGHHADIIDFFIDKDPYAAIEKNLNHTDAIGLSVNNASYQESACIAQNIKEKDPDLPIIIGGPHSTLYREQSLASIPAADISVDGDGEQVLVNIAKTLQGARLLSDVSGVYFRKGAEICHGKPAELIENLDTIPFPARHLLQKYEYGKSSKLFGNHPHLTSLTTTRGCPFSCRYCTQQSVSHHRYRQRSVENVLDEFHEIIDEGYQSVMLADNIFLANQKRAGTILDRIIALNSSLELFSGGNRPDVINRPIAEKMKQAGVKYISIGLISANQDTLDFLHKQFTVAQIQKAVELCDEMGFFIHGGFIIGAPFEDHTHFKKTIDLACSLPLDAVTFYALAYRRGSDLWQDAYGQGKISDAYESFPDKATGLSPLTKEEIFRSCRAANARFRYRPNYFTHLFTKALKTHDSRMVHSTIEEIKQQLYPRRP